MPSNHQGLSMTSREQIIVDLLLAVNAHEEQGHGMHKKCMWKKTKFRLRNQKVGQRGTRQNL